MNDLIHELPPDIREYIDCIMDDIIIFTLDIKTHKKVLKCFMFMLRKYGMLLTVNKVHTFRSKVKYMGLLFSSKDNLLTITPLGSRMKAIFTLPIPLTAWVLNPSLVVLFTWHNFCQSFLSFLNPSMIF